jgi:Tfp pilus assembly major pilin PilA
MHIKHAAGFWLVSFMIIAVVAILSVIAIPHVGQMLAKDEAKERTLELYQVETAVSDMLYQSICHTLEPVGPTSDMSQVHTQDIYPLVLSDYLVGIKVDSGCSYSFAADGTVVQVAP